LAIVGLDYLSTLGYQPSLAYQAAGQLAPLATVVVVLVTLFAALPVYLYLAGRSPHGGGSVALLEHLVPGWRGKLLIVILLGFTATDFIFTRTVSAAAAAEHLVHNPQPLWQSILAGTADACRRCGSSMDNSVGVWLTAHANQQLAVTLILIVVSSLLALIFFRGFTRGILRLAIVVVGVYLVLSAVVIGVGIRHLSDHPDIVVDWWQSIWQGNWQPDGAARGPQSAASLIASCLALFPRLALGLSGFELTMIVMPLVRGRPDDDPRYPRGRIRATRLLLIVAALLGSIALLSSSLVTTLLIPRDAFADHGPAIHRALAYLAHGGTLVGGASSLASWFGPAFGSLYDFSAVAILCLAGASITIGLRDFVPPYLHRLGMELNWTLALGVLVYVFGAIKLMVTIGFKADLDSQRNAYATAVLALLTAAAYVCALDRRRQSKISSWAFSIITLGFAAGTAAAIVGQPSGLQIAACFIAAILISSMISRSVRATELRFKGFEFLSEDSRLLWERLVAMDFPVMVPHRPGGRSLQETEQVVRKSHRLGPDVPVVFVEVTLGDASGFDHRPLMAVSEEDGRYVVRIDRCTSVAHVLAVVALEQSKDSSPPEIHFGWSEESPLTANLHFLLFGHGNVPWMVQYLLIRSEPDPTKRPRVIVG
jgi:hypothetical protein